MNKGASNNQKSSALTNRLHKVMATGENYCGRTINNLNSEISNQINGVSN